MDLTLLMETNVVASFGFHPIQWIGQLLGVIMDGIFRVTSAVGIMNIGLCIIIFTILVNVLMIPLTIKQQKSQKLMAVMQPEIQAIQKKYKGKQDQQSLARQQAETRAVYEKYGTSMAGGCLPLVIQLPILFGLYRVIYNIPAYVPSVKVYFSNVANALMQQGDYVNQIADLAKAAKMPIERYDYTQVNHLINLLYKFNPANWTKLKEIFPALQDVLAANVPAIERMNSFLGLNLSQQPFQGFVPNPAWIIPILSGLTQWYSTKQMSQSQSAGNNDENMMAQQMKTMNTMMPLMSVFFCFTLPAGVGIYWIASALARIIIQAIVNNHLNKIDMETMVQQNIEKANKKREKKGLPPQTVSKAAIINAKNIEKRQEEEEHKLEEKREKSAMQVKDSTEYYNKNAKPGSLSAKANMVAKYDEKVAAKKRKNQNPND